jgi:hypothetical protein
MKKTLFECMGSPWAPDEKWLPAGQEELRTELRHRGKQRVATVGRKLMQPLRHVGLISRQ